jgi:hypothetical protein
MRVLKNTLFCRLFKNAYMQGAQKTEERGVSRNTLSDEVCSATQQMSVFQQPAKGNGSALPGQSLARL